MRPCQLDRMSARAGKGVWLNAYGYQQFGGLSRRRADLVYSFSRHKGDHRLISLWIKQPDQPGTIQQLIPVRPGQGSYVLGWGLTFQGGIKAVQLQCAGHPGLAGMTRPSGLCTSTRMSSSSSSSRLRHWGRIFTGLQLAAGQLPQAGFPCAGPAEHTALLQLYIRR
jgi:hypothetical protein